MLVRYPRCWGLGVDTAVYGRKTGATHVGACTAHRSPVYKHQRNRSLLNITVARGLSDS